MKLTEVIFLTVLLWSGAASAQDVTSERSSAVSFPHFGTVDASSRTTETVAVSAGTDQGSSGDFPSPRHRARVATSHVSSDFGGYIEFDGGLSDLATDGSMLYLGGSFSHVGSKPTLNFASWDGEMWRSMDDGLFRGDPIADISVADGIYAATANGALLTWSGSEWLSLGRANGPIWAIAVDGTNIYIGGSFSSMEGVPATAIAQWDGNGWRSLGDGLTFFGSAPDVKDLAFANGRLYIGGRFSEIAGVVAHGIAFWDGTAWNGLGTEPGDVVEVISASGTDVYAALRKESGAYGITHWSEDVRQDLATSLDGQVHVLMPIGEDLYAGGDFATLDGVEARGIARWDGTEWHSIGGGIEGHVYAISAFGPDLYAGGNFFQAGRVPVEHIARWDGHRWQPLVHDENRGLNHVARDIVSDGSKVYVGGDFTEAGSQKTEQVAAWDGSSWTTFDLEPALRSARTLAVANGRLYVAGTVFEAGMYLIRVFTLEGRTWTQVGEDLRGLQIGGLAVYDDLVYISGVVWSEHDDRYDTHVLRWTGTSWEGFAGDTFNGFVAGSAHVLLANAEFLYAGGGFWEIGGIAATGIARWDGTQWHPVGEGVAGVVRTATFKGSDLYIGGHFEGTEGEPLKNFARWNGATWEGLGEGVHGGTVVDIVFVGSSVYVVTTMEQSPNTLWKWDGDVWHALEQQPQSAATGLAHLDTTFYVVGHFTRFGGLSSNYIAAWHEPAAVLSEQQTVSSGDPAPTEFAEAGVMVDFSSLDANAVLTVTRAETEPTALPSTFTPALDVIWTVTIDGATSFNADVCFSLKDLADIGDSGRLAVMKRPDKTEAWEEVSSEMRSGADASQQICATDLTSFSDFAVAYARSGVANADEHDVPQAYTLERNYPNPFNPRTNIRFALSESAPVRLAVFDVLGREVRVLVEGWQSAGAYEIAFDAGDLPSGTYFSRLESPRGNFVHAMSLAK